MAILPVMDSIQHLVLLSATLLAGGPLVYLVGYVLYNLFLHPLREYPGPLLWRTTSLPRDYHMYHGTLTQKVARLHEQYGEAIRITPDELSYANGQAWKDIWAHVPGKAEWPKDPKRINIPPNGIPNILGATKEPHSRYRRLLSYAFSDKGLREQEGLITKHIDLLVDRLGELAKSGESTNMVDWYNMVAFDIIGDLSWGEAFNSLQDRRVHEWIPAVADQLHYVFVSSIFRKPGLNWIAKYIIPANLIANRVKNYRFAQERVDARIEYGAARGDFWDRILIKSADDNASGEGMTRGEMLNNASVLVLGGSETSSTTLSGATLLLLKNPATMKKLVDEIRTKFKTADEINAESVSNLKYTFAVIEETMRVYPPVVAPGYRIPPQGGGMVLGRHVPEGTTVTVSYLGINKSPAYFHRPDDFVPERWLEDAPAEFANDNKSAFQPFSVGTRNCIGRTLAYAEMRLILAKMLWHYDLELDEQRTKADWFKQTAWGIWAKNPLYVKLRAVQR